MEVQWKYDFMNKILLTIHDKHLFKVLTSYDLHESLNVNSK